jgi:outer membrane protein OmpA-like peptidoglycan-associated protein
LQRVEQIIQDHPDSEYAALSGLVGAKSALTVDRAEDATDLLDWVIEHAALAQIRDVARVRSAQLLLDEGQRDPGLTLLANVDTPAGVATDLRTPGWQAKLSYTNNRREPVVLVGAAPMDLPPVNRAPTIRLRAERTSVRVGESVRLFADVSDPDGDDLTVTWATQAGSINPRQGETVTWSSQGVRPGQGPVSARVSDGYGGTADADLTLTVTAPPPPAEPTMLTFSCSEFPSGNTRIDNRCKAILADVALQLRPNPRATAVIAGHSDSAGSAEVNNTMSLERADNAEAYLVDPHGITGNRIDTVSAGSGEPIADNATAEGRLQNRRIVVVVTIPAQ